MQYFTNWGANSYHADFSDTRLLKASTQADVPKLTNWLHSVIAPLGIVSNAIVLVANGICVIGFHVGGKHPTEVAATFLRGRQFWVSITSDSKSAALYIHPPQDTNLQVN